MKIEKIFCINLPSRPERREHITNELTKHGFNDFRLWRATKMDDGAKGLVASMKALLEHCIAMCFEQCLIMEDDCVFLIDNPQEVIDNCIRQLPRDYDCCYFGVNLCQDEVKLHKPNLIRLTDGYATHCILYSVKGMRKLLAAIEEMETFTPLDVLIKEKMLVDNKSYCSYPMIATQISGFSDIQKREVEYPKFLENRFAEKTKHLSASLIIQT